MDEQFSIEYDIFRVVSSHEPNYATLNELENVYNLSGLFDFLEMLDFKEELAEMAREELARKKLDEKNKRGSRD